MPLILIVSLFFMWGVAHNLNDILIEQFWKAFLLCDFQSGLVQSALYFGHFCFAMPAAIVTQRLGYKSTVVFGLLLYGIGAFLFYPASQMHVYGLFLMALFVIASGLSFLETSANPLVIHLGDPSNEVWRLNLAQAFNPLGALTGVLIGRFFVLSGIEPPQSEIAINPKDPKSVRLKSISPLIENQTIEFPEDEPWSKDFFLELIRFPKGRYSDQVAEIRCCRTSKTSNADYDQNEVRNVKL